MRRIVSMLTVIVSIIGLMYATASADNLIPKKGGVLPEMKLKMPADAAYRAYLGLAGDGNFTIEDIKARVVIIEIYSMYCPHCQREAPHVNELYRAIEANGDARGKVKLIGLGVGNSPYEVDFYRNTYKVPFPLFDDKDYEVHDKLGGPRTPFFIGLKINNDKTHTIFFTQLGGFTSAGEFLELMLKDSGLK